MEAVMTEERLVELRENHGPWHYTEFGVLCSCGEAMDANEECPTLQLVSEIDRLHAELAAVKAEKKSLEVESLCAYIDLLKAENERLKATCEEFAQVQKPVTHAASYYWGPKTKAWMPYTFGRSDGKIVTICGRRATPEKTGQFPTCKSCIKKLSTSRRDIYVEECNGFAFKVHVNLSKGLECACPGWPQAFEEGRPREDCPVHTK